MIMFFVKAKFPPVEVRPNEFVLEVPRKARFENRDAAFAYIAEVLADGAASVTIRPEQPKSCRCR